MKTYYIDGNTMHLAGSQDDISDSFFGSELPESNATVAQRQDAIRFWLSCGWMSDGDVVVWDGIRYIVGEEDKMDKPNQTKPNKKGAKMHTIYDHQLYTELKECLSDGAGNRKLWETLFDEDYNLKNPNIPVLFGGLDHISKTKKFFYFHDIGCNGKDASFRIGDKETSK
jgi:hypothetical protein